MADIDSDRLKAFVSLMVQRGLGLYGQNEMARMCYESGIALTDTNEVEWLDGDPHDNVQRLLVLYGLRNLPARMTAIILARQHNIPVPDILLEKRQKKRRWTFSRR